MQEIIEKRTENSKTFRKDDGTYKQKVFDKPVHYEEDGEWHEISSQPTVEGVTARFEELHNEVSIDLDSYCGDLVIETEGFSITTSVVPVYEDRDDIVNQLMEVSSGDGECVVSQCPCSGIEHRYRVTDNGRIKAEAEITEKDALPDSFAFVITYDGLEAEFSNATRTVKRINRSVDDESKELAEQEIIEEERVEEHPKYIKFVDEEGQEVWQFHDAKYFAPNGEKRAKPFDIQTMGDGKIVGSFDRPTLGWANRAIEEGGLVLDPSYSTGYSTYSDGDTATHTTDGPVTTWNERMYVTGIEDEVTTTYEGNIGSHGTNIAGEIIPDDAQASNDDITYDQGASNSIDLFPEEVLPAMDGEVERVEVQLGVRTEDAIDESDINAQFGWSVEGNSDSYNEWASNFGRIWSHTLAYRGPIDPNDLSHTNVWFDITGNDQVLDGEWFRFSALSNRYTGEVTETTMETSENVSVGSSSFGTLGDGEEESSSTSISSGDNSFSFDIDGSEVVQFRFEYDFSYRPPETPTGLSAEVV